MIAKTILSQIKAIDVWALAAWGAVDLMACPDGLRFKTTGMTPWKGFVEIRYVGGKDLYEIEFFKIRKGEVKSIKTVEDVYAMELVSTIDAFVG